MASTDEAIGTRNPPSSARSAGVVWDLLAFVIGLGCAWLFSWTTTDLVWSLWLSSAVIGYAMIVWSVTGVLRTAIAGAWADSSAGAGQRFGAPAVIGVGTLFVLAFFTVHFGGFHYVHSVFLNQFFPVTGQRTRGLIGMATYLEVFRRYWWFLPAAALAERNAFRAPAPADPAVSIPEAMKARFQQRNSMMQPYRNVIRLHLLIFFFAFAYFTHLASFAVYAVAYAVYFFPWRILRRRAAGPDLPA